MHSVYNFFIAITEKILPLSALFSKKMNLFVKGRRQVFDYLQKQISSSDRIIWLHAASLGEYEQGVPILKKLQKHYPEHKILITFFSPSGFEVKKDNKFSSFTTYLPLDTQKNARQFIETVSPELALFIKYEIWPNYLQQLSRNTIPSLLISGNFRPNQPYFRSTAPFMKEALQTFDHLFVQTRNSEKLLQKHGFQNVSVSGDTRFDRVSQQLQFDNTLHFARDFKNNGLCVVCGSTWPEDESLLIDYINTAPAAVKFIIAPHQIKDDKIDSFRKKLNKSTVLYSQRNTHSLKENSILIIDTVGLLTKLYAYADIAYVGGAAGKTGLHNILEPAAFGVPIIIGQHYQNFPEASQLLKEKGLFSVKTPRECDKILARLVNETQFREDTGKNAGQFIEKNRGATQHIMAYISQTFP